MYADMVLTNGRIATLDKKESVSEAVAAKFGRIVALGSSSELRSAIGPETKLIDLKGRTVIPGLIDSHCHMVGSGLNRESVDLSEEAGVRSIQDLRAKIQEKSQKTTRGEWIIGVKEDDYKLAEKRHPTRWELDQVAPEHPVLISTVGGHFSIANSQAFRMAGVTKQTLDPVGGLFERDPVSGELTGGLHEHAVDLVRGFIKPPSRSQASESARRILLANAASGLTCVYDSGMPTTLRAVSDLKSRGELPIRYRMDYPIAHFPELSSLGITQGIGDEWLKLGGLKMFFDGAISARTAAVSEPYLHRSDWYGIMATTEEEARKQIMSALEAGYRVSAHANGDKAITLYLDLMEEAQKKYPQDDMRNRVIHCTVVNPQIISRIKSLEMLPTIFGSYPYYHGDKLLPAFGERRLESMFAAASFLNAGVKVAAHSDYSASPFFPLMGIHALVNRRSRGGKPVGESQKISVVDALRLYTTYAAYQCFDEGILGSIEVGKCADMVVLGEDILTVPPETIKDIPVDITVVGGNIVHKLGN